jgi:hypothetical protein
MRAFIWLLTISMGILCLGCWAMAEVAESWFRVRMGPLPGLTHLVLQPDGWLLCMPIPWVIYSVVLSVRKELSVRAVFIFVGTIIFAMTLMFCAVTVAGLLPFYCSVAIGK